LSMRARFITVEGIEGVGKSTQLDFIASWMIKHGLAVDVTREPGGTPLAEQIRDVVLTPRSESMPESAELLLIFAARAVHLENRIRPSLAAGKWVLCDRFTDATYAYQGGGRGVSPSRIAELENLVQGDLRPDLTLLLDADPEVGLARARKRGEADRFEQEQISFFQAVRRVYLERARAEPGRIRIVDAEGSPAQVQDAIGRVLEQVFRSWAEVDR